MNLYNYLEQHRSVDSEITMIKSLINTNNVQKDAGNIALHINTLAGKIKIHLSMEDKYLYPELQRSDDERVKKIAADYQKEMGDLAEKFVAYKDMYNTKQKIVQNLLTFKQETAKILMAIEIRIQREEKELYQLI